MTTQDLFLRLGTTSQSRSARADALFRRLRAEESDTLSRQLMRAPGKLTLNERKSAPEIQTKKLD